MTSDETQLDLLWGVLAIARYCNLTKRQAFHALEKHRLPAGKIGGRWVASKAALVAHFAKLTQTEGIARYQGEVASDHEHQTSVKVAHHG